MNIKDLEEVVGYKNYTVCICEYLGFEDTEELKKAKFFSQEQSYSQLPFFGGKLSISNGDFTWRLCRIDNDVPELFSVDYGYKLKLRICDNSGVGSHLYYQFDFLQLLKEGLIIPCKDESQHIEHITWEEYVDNSSWKLVHEADVLV